MTFRFAIPFLPQDFDIRLLEEYALNDDDMADMFDGTNFSDTSKDTQSVNTEVRVRSIDLVVVLEPCR